MEKVQIQRPVVDDERTVMARMAGLLWLTAMTVTLGGQALPNAPREHFWVLLVLAVPIGLHSAACLSGATWTRASLRAHGIGSVLLYPLVGIAIWATDGAFSYITPMLLLSALFVSYFFPPRWAVGLLAELMLVSASPLIYDSGRAAEIHYASWLLAFAAGTIATGLALGHLKRRLVVAERRQREMAHRDPLTGLANRRAFDAALETAIVAAEPFALVFIDLDRFKAVNDRFGHPVGDRVLREIAVGAAAAVRHHDCLARVGGDEFAVVAPGAGTVGAQRLALALGEAVSAVRAGDGEAMMGATISCALYPRDADTAAGLIRVADHSLHERKRALHTRA